MPTPDHPPINTPTMQAAPRAVYSIDPYDLVQCAPDWVNYLGELLDSEEPDTIRALARTTLQFGSINDCALPTYEYPPMPGANFSNYMVGGMGYKPIDALREAYLGGDDLRIKYDEVTEAALAADPTYHRIVQEDQSAFNRESAVPLDQGRVYRLWFFMRRVIDYREAGERERVFYTT